MKLSLSERLLIVNDYLPKEEDFAGLKEIRRAKECLAFTGQEMIDHNIKQDGGLISWNPDSASYFVDVPLTEWVTEQIRAGLRQKNKDKKLVERDFALYQKFIVDYDQV